MKLLILPLTLVLRLSAFAFTAPVLIVLFAHWAQNVSRLNLLLLLWGAFAAYQLNIVAQMRVTRDGLEGAIADFFGRQGEHILQKGIDPATVFPSNFKLFSRFRSLLGTRFKFSEVNLFPLVYSHPVRLFAVVPRDPLKSLGFAKAYASVGGPSFVFLPKYKQPLAPNRKFTLFHELHHISDDGVRQLTNLYFGRLMWFFNCILAIFLAHSFLTWIIAGLFMIDNFLFFFQPNQRESAADNWALEQLDEEERYPVIRDEIEKLKNRLNEAMAYVAQQELRFRLSNMQRVERLALKKAQKFSTHWPIISSPFALPYLVAAIYAGLHLGAGATRPIIYLLAGMTMLALLRMGSYQYQIFRLNQELEHYLKGIDKDDHCEAGSHA